MSVGTFVVTPVPGGEVPAVLGAISVGQRSLPTENLSLGISMTDSDSGKGARVLQTLPRSPGAAVGLRQNDVITRINETDIANHAELAVFFEKVRVGDSLTLTVRRGSEMLLLTLQATEPSGQATRRNAMNEGGPFGVSRIHDGFSNVLQHDSVVRPNDCGGPIVTLDGRLVGINIARGGRTETYAIPMVRFRQIIEELKTAK